MRVVVAILAFLFLSVGLVTGQTLTYSAKDASMDSLSYKLYYYAQWKELFKLGKKHKFKDLPYYTQLRVAYANAWTGKTLLSDDMYLQMAQNKLDTNATKTAAYQLGLSGSFDKVVHLRSKALPAIKNKIIPYQPSIINGIVLETGMGIGPGRYANQELKSLSEDKASYKEHSVFHDNRFIRLGISGNITPIFEWSVDFSGVQVQRTSKHQYQSLNSLGTTPGFYRDFQGNNVPYDSNIYVLTENAYQIKTTTIQQQVRISLGFSPASGIWVRPWGMYGKFNNTGVETKFSLDTFKAQTYHSLNSFAPKYSFPDVKVNQDFWFAGASVEIRKRQFNYTLSGSRGRISNEDITQAGLSISWNPFYNHKLLITPSVFTLIRGTDKPVYFTTLLIDGWIGANWNLQCNFAYGKMTNSQAGNGLYLFNFPEENQLRSGFGIGRTLPGKITVNFNFQYFQMQSTTWIFKPENGLQSFSNPFNIFFMGLGLNKSL